MESSRQVHILLIEDDPQDADKIKHLISECRKSGFQFELVHTGSLKDGIGLFSSQDFQIVFLDLSLPGCSGLDAFRKFFPPSTTVPVVVMANEDNQTDSLVALREGAQDYLLKKYLNVRAMVRIILYAIERKKSKEELRRKEEYLRLLIANISDVIMVLDASGEIRYSSASAERVTGFPSEELTGKKLFDFIHPEDRQDVQKLFKKGGVAAHIVQVLVYRFRHKDGAWRYLESPARNLLDDPVVSGIIITSRDVSDRKKYEKLKDDFVSMVSHELRTPLTSIQEGIAQVLEGIHGPVSDRQNKYLQVTLRGIRRLRGMINNLLDVAKLEAGKIKLHRECVDMNALVEELETFFAPQAQAKGLEMKKKVPGQTLKADADRDKVTQVFSNLIGNALKFTQEGMVEIILEDKEERILCGVRDTGRGISKADLPKVFDKFEQIGREEGEKGTGLGLGICKGLVEKHRGKIWAESEAGKGSKFLFTLPKWNGEGAKKHG